MHKPGFLMAGCIFEGGVLTDGIYVSYGAGKYCKGKL